MRRSRRALHWSGPAPSGLGAPRWWMRRAARPCKRRSSNPSARATLAHRRRAGACSSGTEYRSWSPLGPAAAGEAVTAAARTWGGWGRGCTVAPGLMPASSIATAGHGGGSSRAGPEAAACLAPRPGRALRLRSCRPAPAPPHPFTCQGTLAMPGAVLVGPPEAPGPAASPDSPYPSSSARHRVALPGFASYAAAAGPGGGKRKQKGRGGVLSKSGPTHRGGGRRPTQSAQTLQPLQPRSTPDLRRIPADRGNTATLSPCPHCPVQPVSTVPRLLHWSCKQILAKTANR